MAPDALSVTVAVPSCIRLSRLSSRAPCPWGDVRTSLWRIRGGLELGAGCTNVGGGARAAQPDTRTIAPPASRRVMVLPPSTSTLTACRVRPAGLVDEI